MSSFTSKGRIGLAGIGALIPLALNYLSVEIDRLPHDPWVWLGYLLRVAVLFGIGAVVGYASKSERNAWKLIYLGMGAPALLSSVLNANAARVEKLSIPTVPEVHAAILEEPPQKVEPRIFNFDEKEGSWTNRAYDGALGIDRNWFVLLQAAEDPKAAFATANDIAARFDIRLRVYRLFHVEHRFWIVAGWAMTEREAYAWTEELHRRGLRSATAWRYSS